MVVVAFSLAWLPKSKQHLEVQMLARGRGVQMSREGQPKPDRKHRRTRLVKIWTTIWSLHSTALLEWSHPFYHQPRAIIAAVTN